MDENKEEITIVVEHSEDINQNEEKEIAKEEKENEAKKEIELEKNDNKKGIIKEIGAWAEQNARHRRRMEDAHSIQEDFMGDKEKVFIGVYDGHGGKEAAIYASQTLHTVLAEKIGQNQLSTEELLNVFKETYLETDSRMKGSTVPAHHGCTAATCLITRSKEGEKRQLFVANAGDARVVLCRQDKAIRLTEDHKASDEKEQKRIQEAGGFIINGRVNGQIAITRSLGDHLMKEYVIGDPFITEIDLEEDDQWLIVACDGLWDVIEDQQAMDLLNQNSSDTCTLLSKKLIYKALQDGSTDNLSVVVVRL